MQIVDVFHASVREPLRKAVELFVGKTFPACIDNENHAQRTVDLIQPGIGADF